MMSHRFRDSSLLSLEFLQGEWRRNIAAPATGLLRESN
jgi:hypothetical protein